MRNETKLLLSYTIIIVALLGFTQVPITFAASSAPNVFEILSYGVDITFIGGGPLMKMVVIGPQEFVGNSESPERDPNGESVRPQILGRLFAQVDVPDGATINEFQCKVLDNHDTFDLTCDLLVSSYSDSFSTLVLSTLQTSGANTATQFLSDSGLNHVFDRDDTYLHLRYLQDDDCGACRLFQMKITYTVPSSGITVGGEFYPVDNVSLILAYGLVNSWWIAPTAIGIGVGIYLVKRKIE